MWLSRTLLHLIVSELADGSGKSGWVWAGFKGLFTGRKHHPGCTRPGVLKDLRAKGVRERMRTKGLMPFTRAVCKLWLASPGPR